MTLTIAYATDRTDKPASPDADLLFGAEAIAVFLRLEGIDGMTRNRCYQWIKSGKLPAHKLGGHVTASKSAIRERLKTGMTIP